MRTNLRHPWPVRLWHWVTTLSFILLLVSGLLIFDIHPHLYWGEDGHPGVPALLSLTGTHLDRAVPTTDLQIGSHHWDTTGILGTVLDAGDGGLYLLAFPAPADWQYGATRAWHFAFAWVLGVGIPLYLIYLLISGRLARRLLPDRADLSIRNFVHELRQHLMLRRARGAAANRFNVLQKLTYLIVLGILCPAIIVSGLTMSNAVTAAFPDLFALFGGRQSARTIHFIAALLLSVFVAIHVFEVLIAGFPKLMRSMITGRFAAETKEHT